MRASSSTCTGGAVGDRAGRAYSTGSILARRAAGRTFPVGVVRLALGASCRTCTNTANTRTGCAAAVRESVLSIWAANAAGKGVVCHALGANLKTRAGGADGGAKFADKGGCIWECGSRAGGGACVVNSEVVGRSTGKAV